MNANMQVSDSIGSPQIATAKSQVMCPCCGMPATEFLPFGQPSRPGARCPNCLCLERHRLVWLFLQNCTAFFQDRISVLHFAPEPFFLKTFEGLANLNYISADLNLPTAALKIDITEIPFNDNRIDAVLCSHVLEHIVDDRKAMREIFRVLKPGGWAILLVPIDMKRAVTFEDSSALTPEDRLRLFGQRDHVRIYGRDYTERLAEAGFHVRVIDYVAELGPDAARRFGLKANELIHWCEKRPT